MLTVLALVVVGCGGGHGGSRTQTTKTTASVSTAPRPVARPIVKPPTTLTVSQLEADVAAGLSTKKVPSNLTPALSNAANAKPEIVLNGCHLQHNAVRSKPCIYGDTSSNKTVVLFGDSHAATWFPALQVLSNQYHWRLVDWTKAGCLAPEVNIVFPGGAPYPQCTAWRKNAQNWIASHHPALVVVAWARFIEVPEAQPMPGVSTGFGGPWDDGVAAGFKALRGAAQHILFISDEATLHQLAPVCVSNHLSDVSPCTTDVATAIRLPSEKGRELQIAREEHVASLDPLRWFCSPTRCPVIVGHILLYRDNAHMTPAWSRFIAPVLGQTVVPLVEGRS